MTILDRWREARRRALPWSALGEGCARFERALLAWATWLSEQEREEAGEASRLLLAILRDEMERPGWPHVAFDGLREERMAALLRLHKRVMGCLPALPDWVVTS